MKPETRYAKSDGLNIAYQVIGNGAIDVVFVMGWVSHIDLFWTEPHFSDFLNRIASFARLIIFDKRGTGLSDRPVSLPTLEERMDDVRAVMDAVGSKRAALFGISEGGPMCLLFAATYPDRVTSVIIDGAYARATWAPDYPFAKTVAQRERFYAYMENHWGGDLTLDARAPSLSHDRQFREWWSTYLRMSASPGAAVALSRMNSAIDIREVLPAISVPTLVLHRQGDRSIRVEHGRYLAEHIPGARYVEFPGDDHIPFSYPEPDLILAEIERFLTGAPPTYPSTRTLATLLFTEIVGAAALAARVGDVQWGRLNDTHDRLLRDLFLHYRGREVKRTVTGFLATFDGPARAIECALALIERAGEIGLQLRAGLHTGECQIVEDDVFGVAVQIASRVMSRADAGEVVVSSTVFDLVAGSGIKFARIDRPLITSSDRSFELFRAIDRSPRPMAIPLLPHGRADPDQSASPLSPREGEVAELIGRGLSNRMIADQLCISIATVERHVANIFNKLGCNSRSQVAIWTIEHGLVGMRTT